MTTSHSYSDFAGADKIPASAEVRPVVCIQGLGAVGAAMAAAVAEARDSQGQPAFNVIGVDLPTARGREAVEALNAGRFPYLSGDDSLAAAVGRARETGNLIATSDAQAYGAASVVVIDINLDLSGTPEEPDVDFAPFTQALDTVGRNIPPGCLVVVETTVPPGTCDKVAAPLLAKSAATRDLAEDAFLLAHSYERVMPGNNYLDSIIDYWRVYAGTTREAAAACEKFLSRVINVDDYPLTCLPDTTSSELAKILENGYRAANIAFIEEWSRLAEEIGVDLFGVIDAIRTRPTHVNIRQPGFGVGGYCLTKDPLFGKVAAQKLFHLRDLDFPFSLKAMAVNKAMPLVSVERIARMLEGGLGGRRLLLMGVSYREDVDDTRDTPAAAFLDGVRARGGTVLLNDPLARRWNGEDVGADLPEPDSIDGIVFAVPHRAYRAIDYAAWLDGRQPSILDANNVLTREQRQSLRDAGCPLECIGRGTRT